VLEYNQLSYNIFDIILRVSDT